MTRQECIQQLVKIGFFIPMNELELYHGRAGRLGEIWHVDPKYNNAGNNTGNRNINKISALNTGTKSVAEDFAIHRVAKLKQKNPNIIYRPCVHRITSQFDDAVIYNFDFNYSRLNAAEKKICVECMGFLNQFKLTEYSPVQFEFKDVAKEVYNCLIESARELKEPSQLISVQVEDLAHKKLAERGKYVSDAIVTHIAGANNSKYLLRYNPRLAFHCIINNDNNINTEGKKYSINREVLATFMSENHIVGVKLLVDSATLGGIVDNYLLFSLSDIDDKEFTDRKLSATNRRYSALEKTVGLAGLDKRPQELLSIDSPKELMQIINKLPGMSDYFDVPAGVWEGYTVGEHTEAVLRAFENTYANVLPHTLSCVLRLAIIIHDIEKGVSKKNKLFSDRYFREATKQLYETLDIPIEIQELAGFIAKASQEFTTDYFVHKNKGARAKLDKASLKVLHNIFNYVPSSNECEALRSLCEMMQTCDSGSYTRYGVNRNDATNTYHRGGSDRFTQSFDSPTNLSNTDLHLREPM